MEKTLECWVDFGGGKGSGWAISMGCGRGNCSGADGGFWFCGGLVGDYFMTTGLVRIN